MFYACYTEVIYEQALNHFCEAGPRFISKCGLPYSEGIVVPLSELSKISGVADLQRLDRELDHLRSLDLIDGGFTGDDFATVGTDASIRVTTLALHLFVRGHGFSGSPVEYWNLAMKKGEPDKSVQKTAMTPPPSTTPQALLSDLSRSPQMIVPPTVI